VRDQRLDKLADVLVRYSTKVKKGDLVSITAEANAMPLIEATFEAVLRAGGHPFWTPRSESLQELLLAQGSDEQIRYLSPVDMHRVQTVDVQISFWADQAALDESSSAGRDLGELITEASGTERIAMEDYEVTFFEGELTS